MAHEPECCVNGLIGWGSCPNEWDCPTQTPTVRAAWVLAKAVGGGMLALDWPDGKGMDQVDTELAYAGIHHRARDTRFRLEEKARVEYLAYLYDDSVRRSGTVDPKIVQ